MSMLTRNLKQTITHWPANDDGLGGYVYATPVVMKGRWEDKAELFRNAAGEEVTSDAIVYLEQAVAVGDFLYLGSAPLVTDPATIFGPRQVRKYYEVPSLRALEFEHKALL